MTKNSNTNAGTEAVDAFISMHPDASSDHVPASKGELSVEVQAKILAELDASTLSPSTLTKDTTVLQLPHNKRLRCKRLPTTMRSESEIAQSRAFESIELIVHDLHNLLDDAGCDGIVDYAALEASLKEVLAETINNLVEEA